MFSVFAHSSTPPTCSGTQSKLLSSDLGFTSSRILWFPRGRPRVQRLPVASRRSTVLPVVLSLLEDLLVFNAFQLLHYRASKL
jgi:hypothetical protein